MEFTLRVPFTSSPKTFRFCLPVIEYGQYSCMKNRHCDHALSAGEACLPTGRQSLVKGCMTKSDCFRTLTHESNFWFFAMMLVFSSLRKAGSKSLQGEPLKQSII
jgi:hypothetical protein